MYIWFYLLGRRAVGDPDSFISLAVLVVGLGEKWNQSFRKSQFAFFTQQKDNIVITFSRHIHCLGHRFSDLEFLKVLFGLV